MTNLQNETDEQMQYKETSHLETLDALFQNNEYFTSNTGETKHNSPLIREWSNGVYSFNKNSSKTLPVADNIVNRLIKSYFSLIPLYKGKKTKRVERRIRRLSLNRILVSKAEIKHTNSKVIITVYLFNKNKQILMNKLKKLYKKFTLKLYKPLVTDKTKKPISKNRFLLTSKATLVRKNASKNIGNKKFKFSKNTIKNPLYLNNFDSKDSLVINVEKGLNNDFSSLHKVNKNKAYNIQNPTSIAETKNIIILKNKNIMKKKVKNTLVMSDTKRMLKTQTKKSNVLKTSYNMKFANRLKTRLLRFVSKAIVKSNKNLSLKNKYILLAKKYYSLSNKYKLYSEENLLSDNENYYIYYNNVLKSYSNTNLIDLSINDSKNNLNNYNNVKKAGQFLNLYKNNIHGLKKNSRPVVKSLKNVKYINNIMHKLRSYYKLFYINNTHNSPGLIVKNKEWAGEMKQRYLYKLLKKPLILSNHLNKARVSLGLNKKSNKIGHRNLLFGRNKIKTITQKGVEIVKKARQHKNFLFRILKWNDNNFINYENKFYNKYIKKAYRKELLYLYYIKMISLNTVRFKNWFLIGLKKVISKLYNKKVEFNFVNLKSIQLNSDIFSQAIAIKLRNRENRLLTVLKKALALVSLPSINNVLFYERNYLNNNSKQNKIGTVKNILDSVKYKSVFGVRLEAAGRLSKRLTASRSIFKLKYKGSLKNIDSVYNNKPIALLRGNVKPNLQYTNINTKTRNGSFGLKGWVSGY